MQKINSITPLESIYLQPLTEVEHPVKSLFYLGTLPEERRPTVGIVGTRKPTTYGREVAYQLAYDLAKRGVVIVSGLALGVDGIAHKAALDAGGTTIAVLPTPLDAIAPHTHHTLAKQILESGGALLSEYDPGMQIYKGNFVERNRIVSGLSDGVLIIEAAARSGTLTTAKFALDQGKTVMAVPGNITSPMSEGCNLLLKTGAAPITDVKDILHEIGLTERSAQSALPLGDTVEEQSIIDLLQKGVRDGDDIQKQSKLEPALFNQTLTMLEIKGVVRALGGNHWTLA